MMSAGTSSAGQNSSSPASAATSPASGYLPESTLGPTCCGIDLIGDELVRWEVVQQARVRTTVGDYPGCGVRHPIRQIMADSRGSAGRRRSLLNTRWSLSDMWQKLTGREEVRYNSRSGQDPPRGFEAIAQSVNVPLATVTMDARGRDSEADSSPGENPARHRAADDHPVAGAARSAGRYSGLFPTRSNCPWKMRSLKVVKVTEIYKLREVKVV